MGINTRTRSPDENQHEAMMILQDLKEMREREGKVSTNEAAICRKHNKTFMADDSCPACEIEDRLAGLETLMKEQLIEDVLAGLESGFADLKIEDIYHAHRETLSEAQQSKWEHYLVKAGLL